MIYQSSCAGGGHHVFLTDKGEVVVLTTEEVRAAQLSMEATKALDASLPETLKQPVKR